MRVIAIQIGVILGAIAPAYAQNEGASSPIVVELFTSQGCVACPPADQILAELKAVTGIVPLALHVDYWDYIGWQDAFADPLFTARQEAYARALGETMIYTPQMIVQGVKAVLGGDGPAIGAIVREERARARALPLTVTHEEGILRVLSHEIAPQSLSVQVVDYIPEAAVEIMGGENLGLEMTYVNIVTGIAELGIWQAGQSLTLEVPYEEVGPAYVLVQEPGPGRIVAVAEVN